MEQFRDIEGYEGLYQVSNEGRVRSLWFDKEHILRPSDSGRYLQVILCKDGKQKMHQVHRLVAQAFIPNPDNLPQVNHKDECKTNNNVENLEWSTAKDNCNHATRNTRIAEAMTNGKLSIPIDMLTKDGELVRTFPSSMEAMRWLRANGFPKAAQSSITMCCKGNPNYTHAYGFKWRYTQGN